MKLKDEHRQIANLVNYYDQATRETMLADRKRKTALARLNQLDRQIQAKARTEAKTKPAIMPKGIDYKDRDRVIKTLDTSVVMVSEVFDADTEDQRMVTRNFTRHPDRIPRPVPKYIASLHERKRHIIAVYDLTNNYWGTIDLDRVVKFSVTEDLPAPTAQPIQKQVNGNNGKTTQRYIGDLWRWQKVLYVMQKHGLKPGQPIHINTLIANGRAYFPDFDGNGDPTEMRSQTHSALLYAGADARRKIRSPYFHKHGNGFWSMTQAGYDLEIK